MPIRICYLIDNLAVAGTERFLLSLISRLDRAKVVPYLCLLDGTSQESRSLEPQGCAVERLGIRSLRHPATCLQAVRFFKYLRRNQIDVLHTLFPDSTYFGVPVARLAGVKSIRTRRNTGYWLTPFRRRMERWIGRVATVTVANCEAAKQSVIDDDATAAVEVIRNGVDIERFQACDLQQRQPRVVGIMANLRPVKNISLLIDAAAILADRFPNVIYQIAGEGDLLAALQAQADCLGVSDRITFLGRLDNVAPFLANTDVAVLCSDAEGTSNAILEYMSAGRPIVATAVGGTRELIQHERTGLLVPAGDATALAASIARLLSDRMLSAQLGAAARQIAIEQYSTAAETRHYEDLYLRLTNANVPASHQTAASTEYAVS